RDPNWTTHIPTDLSEPESINNFISKAIEALNGAPLHALVNNAGLSPKTPYKERLGCLNGDIDAWHEVFEINFFAALRLSRGFASQLHKGKGAIVNITSIAGHSIHPFAGSAYSISKAALSALTREMANEFADLDVRVNAVAPGEIETSMIQPEYEALIPRIPLERMGSPRDVATTVYYLCSEDSNYVTGTEIWVTGGQHMF
ncbi:MAG: SDR family oxidoreductase, partial [Rhodospirillaceae bacterium]|nr:SDR family oxidoreductase [Rhodospirillaceae bacterium]